MKPVLDVPFVPEQQYVDYLNDCGNRIDCVQFSLDTTAGLDNRVSAGLQKGSDQLAPLLRELSHPRKYGLLNSRFYSPVLFTDPSKIQAIIDHLDFLAQQGVIDGIVYCDHYLLQMLSDEAPSLAASLEAVPGINTMLDSFDKVEAQFAYISETRFKAPGKIILDRSLNRDLDRLAKISRKCRKRFPKMKIELLANEGCLDYCPYKLTHDAYIGLSNYEESDCTFLLNKGLGCLRLVDEKPHRILRSPFIRPEDVTLYQDYVDTIKLCGRTLGSSFLQRAIGAYLQRQYNGNLLDLLDALSWLVPSLYVDNASLSFDFVEILSLCDKKCAACGFCKELFPTLSCSLPLKLTDHRRHS
jgi:collagenase-like PrtC family protease